MSDFYQDQGAFLVKLMHDAPVPGFVKTAEYETEEGITALPDLAFADPVNRQYPIHTPADVYLSAAYLWGKTASGQEIANNIIKAGSVFGIDSDLVYIISKAKARFEQSQKIAEGPARWDFETKTASFAGAGCEQLTDAANFLEKNYAAYGFSERTEIAQNLSKIASDLGVELPLSIEKFAGLAHVDLEGLEVQLQARALLLRDQRDTEGFLSKISELRHAADATPEEAMKVAEFIDGFDNEYGLTRFYGNRLEDPHSAVFNTSKVAHDDSVATVKIGHVVHKLIDLRSHQGDLFEGVLGEKVADLRSLANLDEEKARRLNQILA